MTIVKKKHSSSTQNASRRPKAGNSCSESPLRGLCIMHFKIILATRKPLAVALEMGSSTLIFPL